jgi:formylglycine-generating enzyme required for sulfatase activity
MGVSTRSAFEPLVGSAINASSDRRAMGYPEHYTPTRSEAPVEVYRRLRGMSIGDLVTRIEDASVLLEERLVAGHLAAILGDTRIKTFDPTMIDIVGGCALIGLETEKVDEVVADLANVGVLREWIEKECPTFMVTLAPYRIAKYPVTNQEYREFLAETGFGELPTSWEFGRYPHEKANHPVYSVTERAADEYATWLSARTKRRFRLLTEAEWEYAAAGPNRLEYPWGNEFDAERANTLECGLLCSTPVGAFPLGNSPFGVCDMAGNVEEWVADDYRPYPGSSVLVEDDLARSLGRYRIARGGAFTRFRDLARSKRRHGRYPKAIYLMGFRLAEGTCTHI